MKLKAIREPEVDVICLDCARIFSEGELIIDGIEWNTEKCPHCGSENIANADGYLSSDASL